MNQTQRKIVSLCNLHVLLEPSFTLCSRGLFVHFFTLIAVYFFIFFFKLAKFCYHTRKTQPEQQKHRDETGEIDQNRAVDIQTVYIVILSR